MGRRDPGSIYNAMSDQKGIETIKNGEDLVAIIIHRDFYQEGVQFFTPESFPQQLGFIAHKAGQIIEPHIHNIARREISVTQEVLFIRKGKLRVDFYDSQQRYLDSRVLETGDVILLAGQGHGYEILEDIEMIEIKQGPYLGKDDKIRFERKRDS